MFPKKYVILAIIPLLINPSIIYAQGNESESHIQIYKLIHAGKEFDIPYIIFGGQLKEIKVVGEMVERTMILSVTTDIEKRGSLDIALPFELIKMFHPAATSDKNLESIIVLADGELVKHDISLIGSRVTVSIDFPIFGAEEIEIKGTFLPAEHPSIVLETSKKWYKQNDKIEIAGKISGVEPIADINIRIEVHDALDNVVTNELVKTDQSGRFLLTTKIPDVVTGGLYEISGEIVRLPIQRTKGFDFFYVNAPGFYKVSTEGLQQTFFISSNSSSYEPFFMKKAKTLGLLITGQQSTTGQTKLEIPHSMLDGEIALSHNTKNFQYVVDKNSTHSIITLHYLHKRSALVTEIVGSTVIPEFPASILITIGATGAMLAIMRFRKYIGF